MIVVFASFVINPDPMVPSLQLEGPVALPEPRSDAKEDTKEEPGQARSVSCRLPGRA